MTQFSHSTNMSSRSSASQLTSTACFVSTFALVTAAVNANAACSNAAAGLAQAANADIGVVWKMLPARELICPWEPADHPRNPAPTRRFKSALNENRE